MIEHCPCCYGSDLGYETPIYSDLIAHYHPVCPIHGFLSDDLPGTGG